MMTFSPQTSYSQMYIPDGVSPEIHETCDNIDLWAMWISPPVFVIFNLAYWLFYQHFYEDLVLNDI